MNDTTVAKSKRTVYWCKLNFRVRIITFSLEEHQMTSLFYSSTKKIITSVENLILFPWCQDAGHSTGNAILHSFWTPLPLHKMYKKKTDTMWLLQWMSSPQSTVRVFYWYDEGQNWFTLRIFPSNFLSWRFNCFGTFNKKRKS